VRAPEPIDFLRRKLAMARRGVALWRQTDVTRGLGPLVALRAAKDYALGRRGALAIIHYHALRDPNRPAIVSGATRLTYGKLEERVNRLTHGLGRRAGMLPGDRIGALLHNGHEYLELNAALPSVGGVAVQIGYRLKGPEVAYLLENSGAKAMVFHHDLAPTVDEALRELRGRSVQIARERCFAVGGAVAGFPAYEELFAIGDATRPAVTRGGGFSGVMVYTSGTTGKAKGAARDFRKLGFEPIVHFLTEFPIRGDERHLVVCPLYHSAAPAFVAMTMGVGGCVVILPKFDAEEVLATIERERITSSLMVPTMLARLCALPPEEIRRRDTSSLRWVMSGAAPLPTETARAFEDAFGPILYNFYGATETGLVTLAKPGEHTARPGTIGRAIGGNEIRLLDSDGNQVPDGQVGEVYVKNAMMMDGYHGNDAATRAAMKEGFFSVGDLAWRDPDGFFYLAERKSDMVISGGVNIYPWEIEQRLHEHPGVADVAVVGVPDPDWGEALGAFVVPKPGQPPPSQEELSQHVRAALADFKRPRFYWFVDELPRNPTGKILKRELRQRAIAELTAMTTETPPGGAS